jgi:hypothetical protein
LAKVILDRREAEIFRKGKALVPAGKEEFGVIPGNSENITDLYEYQKLITDTVLMLAGHLGGLGIDFVDEDGNVLDSEIGYMNPLLEYHAAIGTAQISITDLKSN